MLTTLLSHSWKKLQAIIELATCHWSPHLCGVHIRVKINKWKDSSELELWSKAIWGRNERFLLCWFLCFWVIDTEGGRPLSWCYDCCQFLMSCSILTHKNPGQFLLIGKWWGIQKRPNGPLITCFRSCFWNKTPPCEKYVMLTLYMTFGRLWIRGKKNT